MLKDLKPDEPRNIDDNVSQCIYYSVNSSVTKKIGKLTIILFEEAINCKIYPYC